jgi:hypothetical protein
MRKKIFFGAASILTLIFFACEFTIPKTVEFKGTPLVRFVETVNIGDMFTDLLNDAFNEAENEGITIIPCLNTPNYTYLIYMELFDDELANDLDDPSMGFNGADEEWGDLFEELADGQEHPLSKDMVMMESEPVEMPFSSVGDYLEGFEFTELRTRLYFSGSSPLIDRLKIRVTINTKDNEGNKIDETQEIVIPIIKESKINDWLEGYTAVKSPFELYPSEGVDFDLPFDENDKEILVSVYIPEGTGVILTDFESGNFKCEIVVWLPFVLEADATDGGIISFPPDALFSSTDDLFGRDAAGEDNLMADVIEILRLDIKLDYSPFQGSDLIVYTEKGIELKNKLTDNYLSCAISKKNMEKINNPDYFPFIPNFKMLFSPGATLSFPQEFNAVEFMFRAKINYKLDL